MVLHAGVRVGVGRCRQVWTYMGDWVSMGQTVWAGMDDISLKGLCAQPP